MKKNILIVLIIIMCLFMVSGCKNKEDNKNGENNSTNNNSLKDNVEIESDNEEVINIFKENGIDLISIKPEKTVETKTYKEAGINNKKGVLFILDKDAKTLKKDEFVRILNYLQAISSDDKIYNKNNLEYDFLTNLKDDVKNEDFIYIYKGKKILVTIEFREEKCANDMCETYGISFN